jgi:hypothetical protein
MQKEICKEKSQETSRFPPHDRVISNRTDKVQHLSRYVRNKRENVANVNFLTTNNLKFISSLEMDYFFGEGLFHNGATPTELIKQLYPLMKDDLDVFLHTKVFNEETNPIEFLNWMLLLYEEIHHDAHWSIEEDRESEHHIYRIYDYTHDENGRSVGLQFLPQIKRENKELYKLLTGALKLLIPLGIPFWWQDDEFEYALDMVESDIYEYKIDLKDLDNVGDEECRVPEEDRAERRKEIKGYIRESKKTLKEYKDGVVPETQNDIEIAEFSFSDYNEFIARTSLEEYCKEFIDKLLKFVDEYHKDNLMRYVHFLKEELEEAIPISPHQYCAIGWSYNDDDLVSDKKSMITQSTWNEYGAVPFRYMEKDDIDSEISLMPFDWFVVLNSLQDVASEFR